MAWKYAVVLLLGWVGSNIWEKHGPKVAERFPIVEKLGLAEPPTTVVWCDGNPPSSGSTRDDDDDE